MFFWRRRWVDTVKYEVLFFWISTSRIICVLRGFLDATSRSPRVLPFEVQFGPQKDLQKELKRALGPQNVGLGHPWAKFNERRYFSCSFGCHFGPILRWFWSSKSIQKSAWFHNQNQKPQMGPKCSEEGPSNLENRWFSFEGLLFSGFHTFGLETLWRSLFEIIRGHFGNFL